MEEEKLPIFTPSDYAGNDLLINPFFYKRKQGLVDSLEDFAITVKLGLFKKKEVVFIHSLVRNSQIENKKRFKIFKKYIKSCKKDFDSNLSDRKEENENEKKEFSSIDFKKVGLRRFFCSFLFLALSVFLSLMFFSGFTNVLGLEFINKLNSNLSSFMSAYKMYTWLGIIVINLLSLWFFVFLIIFKIANDKYARIQKRKEKAFDRYMASAKKAIKKCYKRVIKYYKKNILSDSFNYEALTLDELWDLDVTVDESDIQTENLAKKNKKIIKRNKNFERNCRLFNGLIIILIIAALVFEVIEIFI